MTVPGIGPIISSATVAAIGTGDAFAKGCDFGAWLGLVPKQISTGDRTILGRISKRGNKYLRTLFVQAARVVLLRPAAWARHGLQPWIAAAAQRWAIVTRTQVPSPRPQGKSELLSCPGANVVADLARVVDPSRSTSGRHDKRPNERRSRNTIRREGGCWNPPAACAVIPTSCCRNTAPMRSVDLPRTGDGGEAMRSGNRLVGLLPLRLKSSHHDNLYHCSRMAGVLGRICLLAALGNAETQTLHGQRS
jgi:hypothetical protein